MKEITVKNKYGNTQTEKYGTDPDTFCPSCAQRGGLYYEITTYNEEDNAGLYYICANCYGDRHMCDDGYRGKDATKSRIDDLTKNNE